MLLGAFCKAGYDYADPTYGETSIGGIGGVFLLGIGSLVLGVILMFVWQAKAPAFFRGETLPKRTAEELALEGSSGPHPGAGLADPGESAR